MHSLRERWPVIAAAGTIIGILILTLAPYRGNPTALFHMDQERAEHYHIPAGFVVLDVPGYDGMQYYYIARNMPALVWPEPRAQLRTESALSYSYQRFLLPLGAWLLALGADALLPWSFLLINVLALVGASALLLRWKRDAWLPAIALAICPGAMVGLHFSLAEPLTLIVITAALLQRLSGKPADLLTIALISGAVLAREVNILFALFLMGHAVLRRQWKDAVLLVIPLLVFIAWHGIIWLLFDQIPFLWSAEKRNLPFVAMLEILSGAKGWNRLTLSSVALMTGFFLPALALALSKLRRAPLDLLGLGTLAFLLVMSVMPDHIWGSMTSIGRVITPVYPCALLLAAREKGWMAQWLAIGTVLLGLAIALGLALTVHPYHLR